MSDNEDIEIDYQKYQPIGKDYFDSPVVNKKELDFQNHQIEVTRNRTKDKTNRMEDNFDKYNQMEQNNLRNRKMNNMNDEMLGNNLLNSNYHFIEDDLVDQNIESNNQYVESENVETEEREPFVASENNKASRKEIQNIDLKIHEKLLINIMERLDAIDKKLSIKKEERNNVHDIILFIVIGIFILFALDSIFRIGRMTV
tara:strand:- start:82 stop:681 length:600 start_codon:yes stop_codon:yes gene_type:complete